MPSVRARPPGERTSKQRRISATCLGSALRGEAAVMTGSYLGEGFDCPALDTLFLIAFKGRLVQYVGRIVRPYPGKELVQVHDYHDADVGVLAHSLNKRSPGYVSLGFPDPR